MTNQSAEKAGWRSALEGRNFLLLGVGAVAVLSIIVAIVIWQRTAIPIEFLGGDEAPIVLLGNPYETRYEFRNTSDKPLSVDRFVPMLKGQFIYVDVEEVRLQVGDQEAVMEVGGRIPAGESFVVAPGGAFEVFVTYMGQELGGNQVFGFRIAYTVDGSTVESDLQIEEGYGVYVE
jgi:hypothetical protein